MSVPHEYSDLLFGVRRSVRYHDKREGWFLAIGDTADYLVFLLSAITTWLITFEWSNGRPWFVALFPVFIAAGRGIALVLRVGSRASRHNALKRQFITLEQKLIECGDEATAEQLKKITQERLAIEADEPPVLRVLDTLCHNELAYSMGYAEKEFKPVSPIQRAFAHLTDINPESLRAS